MSGLDCHVVGFTTGLAADMFGLTVGRLILRLGHACPLEWALLLLLLLLLLPTVFCVTMSA